MFSDLNFSNDLPPAPSRKLNVRWQMDSANNVSANIPLSSQNVSVSVNSVPLSDDFDWSINQPKPITVNGL